MISQNFVTYLLSRYVRIAHICFISVAPAAVSSQAPAYNAGVALIGCRNRGFSPNLASFADDVVENFPDLRHFEF